MKGIISTVFPLQSCSEVSPYHVEASEVNHTAVLRIETDDAVHHRRAVA